METGLPAFLVLILLVFALVLAVCWIVLPFALIGTKPLLRELISLQQRTNSLLEQAERERNGRS